MATLYILEANCTSEHDGCPRDALFGYEPTVYATKAEAEKRAKELGEVGDWGEVGPPEYYVSAVDHAELRGAWREEAKERFPCLFEGHSWHRGGTIISRDGTAREDVYCQLCGATKA